MLTADHQPVRFMLGEALRTRFGASTFEKKLDAVRRNPDFDIDDEVALGRLKEIDTWAMDIKSRQTAKGC